MVPRRRSRSAWSWRPVSVPKDTERGSGSRVLANSSSLRSREARGGTDGRNPSATKPMRSTGIGSKPSVKAGEPARSS